MTDKPLHNQCGENPETERQQIAEHRKFYLKCVLSSVVSALLGSLFCNLLLSLLR